MAGKPYKRGQEVAYLTVSGDGLRVTRDRVRRIDRYDQDPALWWVVTDSGQGLVDDSGEGPNIIPLGAELEAKLAGRQDFVAEPVRATYWESEVAERRESEPQLDIDDRHTPLSPREIQDESQRDQGPVSSPEDTGPPEGYTIRTPGVWDPEIASDETQNTQDLGGESSQSEPDTDPPDIAPQQRDQGDDGHKGRGLGR